MRLRGKTVIVTGASSGIGRAAVRAFAGAGCNVVLASRNEAALHNLAKKLEKRPGRRLVVPTDVREPDAVEAMVANTVREFGSVDILVNNAGVGLNATIADGDVENMRYLVDLNLFGYIHGIQAVVPRMRRQRSGMIINVSSVAGRISTPYNGLYSATKAAITAMTDALRLELAQDGIHVAVVLPGYTVTRFHENVIREIEMPDYPSLLRGAPAKAVAKAIVATARDGRREAYVTLGDRAAVTLKWLVPGLVDWGLKRLWLRPKGPASS